MFSIVFIFNSKLSINFNTFQNAHFFLQSVVILNVYSVPGVIGTLQALEALKIALGMSDVLSSKLLLFDGENTSFRTMNLRKKNPSCPVCGTNPTIKQLIDYEEFCGATANDKV